MALAAGVVTLDVCVSGITQHSRHAPLRLFERRLLRGVAFLLRRLRPSCFVSPLWFVLSVVVSFRPCCFVLFRLVVFSVSSGFPLSAASPPLKDLTGYYYQSGPLSLLFLAFWASTCGNDEKKRENFGQN